MYNIAMSATLGGLIKDYRLQKNISQLEIAFAMGWSEPSRLSRIEQGKVNNPPREFLDKIIKIMKLEEKEKNELLLAGNYLPTIEDINIAKKAYNPFIKNWLYPASICDFSWRIIDTNDIHNTIYCFTNSQLQKIKNYQVNILEILFDENYILNKYLKNKESDEWHIFLIYMLSQFKLIQKSRMKDLWYVSLLKKMMNNDLFKNSWQKAQFIPNSGIMKDFGLKKLINPDYKSKRLEFFFFLEPLIIDPRFQIELHIPANKETFDYFKK
jgi:transcriptional regulator with XRE-family HTH domain